MKEVMKWISFVVTTALNRILYYWLRKFWGNSVQGRLFTCFEKDRNCKINLIIEITTVTLYNYI